MPPFIAHRITVKYLEQGHKEVSYDDTVLCVCLFLCLSLVLSTYSTAIKGATSFSPKRKIVGSRDSSYCDVRWWIRSLRKFLIQKVRLWYGGKIGARGAPHSFSADPKIEAEPSDGRMTALRFHAREVIVFHRVRAALRAFQ